MNRLLPLPNCIPAIALLATLAGCGPSVTGVVGLVTLDGRPLQGAVVSFHPQGDTAGLGGFGRTDSDGNFVILPRRTQIETGLHRVVVSRLLQPDGSLPDPDVPPIESNASESLLPIYSDLEQTTLVANVGMDGTGSFSFALKSGK